MSSSDSQRGFGVVLFRSVHGAFAAEKLLIGAGVAHKLIAVPRELGTSCGFCVRFDWADREEIAKLLSSSSLGVEAIVAL